MTDDPHAAGGPPTYVTAGARTPTHGERVRTLLAGASDGVLSTLALDPEGYPFGSIVTYGLADDGAPLVLMSTMAEHARNLARDPRASVLVAAAGDGAGRLAVARASLVGSMRRVADDDHEAALERYLAAHPNAFWARFPDFFVARLEVEAIRWVRGFGEMSWVTPEAYATAEPDPLASSEAGIVEHMNDDHRDAMAAMVDAFLDVDGEVADVTMTSCDRYGFELRLGLAPAAPGGDAGLAFARVGFDEPADDAGACRRAMVALTRRARGA